MALGTMPGRSALFADDPPKPAVVVLDDCDPDFKKGEPHRDGVRMISADGKELWSIKSFNNCEAIGNNHGVALDPKRGRIYVREMVSKRITSFDLSGKVVYQVENTGANALAVDPLTGNLWCTCGAILGTLVLDVDGKRVVGHEAGGFDIDYDPVDQAFWVFHEKTIKKIDRAGGREIVKGGPSAVWAYVSVATDPTSGGAWVVERSHPQVPGSIDQVIRLSSEGDVIKKVTRPNWRPFGVACDPKTGGAWVAALRQAVYRVPADEGPLKELPIPANAIAAGRETGHIWVATIDDLIRLDADGNVVVKSPLGEASMQSSLAAY